MRSKDKNKSFNIFHTRFIIVIILLRYSKDYKIRDLRRYIFTNLRSQVINRVKPLLYRDFIIRLRTYNLEIR